MSQLVFVYILFTNSMKGKKYPVSFVSLMATLKFDNNNCSSSKPTESHFCPFFGSKDMLLSVIMSGSLEEQLLILSQIEWFYSFQPKFVHNAHTESVLMVIYNVILSWMTL